MITEIIKVANLTMDAENAKLHPDWQVQTIVESIKQFGYCDPIAVRGQNNLIIEGHGRYLALKQLEIEEVECIRLDHLTDEQAKAYAIAHNSTNMATGFDEELLQKQIASLTDIYDMALFGVQLSKLDDAMSAEEDNYEIPEAIPPRVKLGEIWELGRHRLICGDSTEEETFNRLFKIDGGGGS